MGADSDSLTNDQVDTMKDAIVSREGIAEPLITIKNEKTKDQRVYAQYVWKEIITLQNYPKHYAKIKQKKKYCFGMLF